MRNYNCWGEFLQNAGSVTRVKTYSYLINISGHFQRFGAKVPRVRPGSMVQTCNPSYSGGRD
jgi:hypothetical protein